MEFEPIKRKTLGDDVITQLKNLIINGELKVGDKLPNERELCTLLNVSRSSLREGLMVLSQQGLISRMTKGTYITADFSKVIEESLTFQILLNDSSFSEIQEARLSLEVALTGYAAERRTDEDLNELKEHLDLLKVAFEKMDKDLQIQADMGFHKGIAASAKNKTLQYLYNTITHLVFKVQKQVAYDEGVFEYSYKFHTEIYDLLVKKDVKEAQLKMEEHLRDVQKRLQLLDKDVVLDSHLEG
ncbi:FadR/GntR family transcriptional regulator [Ammoniphilus resinae]|uniref:GntR family transcriptional repressor for pyruvate dehydrogenase complex n=1 Tax=Ammoniphilus resinae TaxID=861532 RepID=A0ABS4GR94_9BACL|nr:FadR/GntR family transcriptional regulator [Ammoniphilus resinae]MBP1932776.1 GntR family transcriptional repressor for pyruvate dehydrogenase complex [Ammoniphilus resinae]